MVVKGIRCLKCKDEIVSLFRHHFVECSCKSCFVDGGRAYTRVGGNEGDWEYIDVDLDKLDKTLGSVPSSAYERVGERRVQKSLGWHSRAGQTEGQKTAEKQ